MYIALNGAFDGCKCIQAIKLEVIHDCQVPTIPADRKQDESAVSFCRRKKRDTGTYK